jgi:hypothetical protein
MTRLGGPKMPARGTRFEHVDDAAARRLKDLADRVRVILIAAEIPASASVGPNPDGGAVIAVDTGADEADGVYIVAVGNSGVSISIEHHRLLSGRSRVRVAVGALPLIASVSLPACGNAGSEEAKMT